MVKYHLDKNNVPRKCTATVKECPLDPSGTEHFDTFEEAENHAYARSPKMSLKMLQTKFLKQSYAVMKNTPLKELDAGELVITLNHEATKAGIPKESIESAIALATILHSHQKRANRGKHKTTPYIEHPLRNSLRLIRLGVRDRDIIVANILHDAVEDGSLKFSKKFTREPTNDVHQARDQLRGHINKVYGARCLKIVDGVTNPVEERREIPNDEKRRNYFEKVSKSIKDKDEGILITKLSDYMDNAGGLHHNDVPGREMKTYRQALKYRPLIDEFKREINNRDFKGIFNNEVEAKKYFISKLNETSKRLDGIITNEGRSRN